MHTVHINPDAADTSTEHARWKNNWFGGTTTVRNHFDAISTGFINKVTAKIIKSTYG